MTVTAYVTRYGRPITEEEIIEGFKCMDCEVFTRSKWGGIDEYYMVNWELWYQATGFYDLVYDPDNKDNGMLCIGCLENRIGRKLNRNDFMDAPVNDLSIPDMRSDRLINRLTRHG